MKSEHTSDSAKRRKSSRKNLHLRGRRGRWFAENKLPEKFPAFAEVMLGMVEFKGYKLAERKRIAMHCLHRLIGTGLSDRCVLDTRDATKPGVRMRVAVWDAIVAAGLATKCTGSESSGKVTRYAATKKLLFARKVWKLCLTTNLTLERNSKRVKPTAQALVSIKQKGKLLDVPKSGIVTMAEDILESFNSNNLEHRWKAKNLKGHTFQPNPCLRQIYSGSFFRLGRFYTFGDVAGQSLSKSIRRSMRIDGKRTAELDLEGSLVRMIYHKYGIDPDPEVDIYQPEKIFPKLHEFNNLSSRNKNIVRKFVKKATIICLNTKSRSAANSSVGLLLRKDSAQEFLRNAIYNTEKTTPKGIVRRIARLHKPIAADFFSDTGPWMMTREANIMQSVMLAFTMHGKPALVIHDAIIVKRSDVDFARDSITQSYRLWMDFDPVIKRSY